MEALISISPLLLGYVLDLLLGDPRMLPHPIRLFGNAISLGTRLLNHGTHRFLKGLLLTALLCAATFLFFWFLMQWTAQYLYVSLSIGSIFLFYALANKSLLEEGNAVFTALEKGIEEGRSRLSWIVGRDTRSLDTQQITKAVFETVSENLSDGVIAPLFYYAFLGIPGAMLYKMINTLDSMIGYKNDRYFYFGKFAAKLDDVFNFIPARLTAMLMLLVSGKLHKLPTVMRQAKNHTSPNAGYPEAALAIILDCQFGGPNVYHGKLVNKPYIGTNSRQVLPTEFKAVSKINQRSTFCFVVLIAILQYLYYTL